MKRERICRRPSARWLDYVRRSMTPTVAGIMMIVLCLTGCAGAKRLQTAQSSATLATATTESREHAAQTSNGESLTIADDNLEMQWLKVEFYPPDSIGRQAIKSEERACARHTRQEQTSESMAVETATTRSDSLRARVECHSKADRTELKEHSNCIGTELLLLAAGAIAIFLFRYMRKQK